MTKSINIRQLINTSAQKEVSDDLLLVQTGITSTTGNLTALGRRVQADRLFNGGNGSKEDLASVVREALTPEEDEVNTDRAQ